MSCASARGSVHWHPNYALPLSNSTIGISIIIPSQPLASSSPALTRSTISTMSLLLGFPLGFTSLHLLPSQPPASASSSLRRGTPWLHTSSLALSQESPFWSLTATHGRILTSEKARTMNSLINHATSITKTFRRSHHITGK